MSIGLTAISSDSNRDVDNKDQEQEGFTEEYDSLANYFAYILNAPLYIAGPIVTSSKGKHPQKACLSTSCAGCCAWPLWSISLTVFRSSQ